MANSQRKTANLTPNQKITSSSYSYTITTHPLINALKSITPNENYTLSWEFSSNGSGGVYNQIRLYTSASGTLIKILQLGVSFKLTSEEISQIGALFCYFGIGNTDGYMDKFMLVEGSTPLPYEPYGWVHSLRKLGTSTDTLTTLPADLYADGTNATIGLKGNMSQSGTPTPSSPIQPSETGDRTGNLFDESILTYGKWTNSNGTVDDADYGAVSAQIEALNETYSAKCFGVEPYSFAISWYDIDNTFISRQLFIGHMLTNGVQITTPQNAVKMTYQVSHMTSLTYPLTSDEVNAFKLTLVEGSTAPSSYIPFGYKIPISSASTTTPVYLGEVQTTRRIRKYEFTGQEDWSISNNERVLYTALADHLTSNELICYCSHYKSIANVSAMSALSNGECAFNNTLRWFYIKDDNYNDATTFKTYLQQQYSAGTPVTVWYVLANSQTAVVNEPLRKIGDYADTVSGITVPTITGKDSFDVLTTLKPSEVSLAYTGWHDASVGEWDGSEWQ